LFSLRPFVEGFSKYTTAVLEAVKKSPTVKHIVKLSAIGVDGPNALGMTFHDEHSKVDAEVAASGLSYTIVMPNFFMRSKDMLFESSMPFTDHLKTHQSCTSVPATLLPSLQQLPSSRPSTIIRRIPSQDPKV
jgi:uncharacterized protein YbjT (DUF2867 family)